jgi:hypothetical protein
MVGPLIFCIPMNIKKIITSDMNDLYNCSRWRDMVVYHVYNTFNLEDHLRIDM